MDLAGRLGDDVGHTQLDDQHGGQDAHVHLLTDADGDGVAVLDARFFEGGLAEVVHRKGVVGIAAHLADFFLTLVDGDDFFARTRQGLDQRGAEPAQADDAVKRGGFVLLLHTLHLS